MRAGNLVSSGEEYISPNHVSQNVSQNSSHSQNRGRALGDKGKTVTYESHGSISVKGKRSHMEDTLTVKLGLMMRGSKNYDYFGVYDGHGGSKVAKACRDNLHRLVKKEVEEETGEVIDWEKVMVTTFHRMDQLVSANKISFSTGSTAVVAVVGEEVLVVANCGDSRAVLSRAGFAVPLSNDHKPTRPDESRRIEVSGGVIVHWHGARVLGVLATSRSIGDDSLKPYVIAKPEVRVMSRSNYDEFIILASDGLWDVISSEDACKVVQMCLKRPAHDKSKNTAIVDHNPTKSRAAIAARNLKRVAMNRGSQDNISVIVVDLNRGKSSA